MSTWNLNIKEKVAAMKAIQIVLAILITTFVSVSHAGILKLQVSDDGTLLGAENVVVNDKFYNVSFQDGFCFRLYNGCNDASDFVFNTEADADAASQALLAQVFRDVGDNLFDSKPELTNYCTNTIFCTAITPFAAGTIISQNGSEFKIIQVYSGVGAGNFKADYARDGWGLYEELCRTNEVGCKPTAYWSGYNLAVWTVAEVPAPNAVYIMLMGIGGLLVFRRRKQY